MGRKKKIMSKIICFVMCMALVLAYVPYDAKAEESVVVLDVSVDYIIITDEGYQQGNSPELTPYTGDYIITGTTDDSNHYVQIKSKAEGSTITLKDLTMKTETTVPISIWEPMEIYATGDVNLLGSAFCFNFINTNQFAIKGDANIVLESYPLYSIKTDEMDLDIECNSIDFEGIYLISGSIDINAAEDITSTADIFISTSYNNPRPVTLSAGGDITIGQGNYPAVECTSLTVNAGGDFNIAADEAIYGPVIEGNVDLNVGGNVSITTEYGTGIGGELSGTVGGDFVLTGYMAPLCKNMNLTAKSVYMEITDASSSYAMIETGGNGNVNITATDGDITFKLASPNGGAISANVSNLISTNGDVILTNDANKYILTGNANIDAQNIILTNLRSEAPVITGYANLNAKESITINTESQVGISGGNRMVSFGDTYTETNANATYVIKKGNTTDYIYNGASQYADITVTKDGTALTNGTDFTLTYTKGGATVAEPVDAGAYRAAVKDSEGNTIVDMAYDIKPYDISDAKITVDATEFTYDGKEKIVNVSKVGEFTFSSTDFSVTGNKATEVGEYNVTVEAASDNFTGSASAKFVIAKAEEKPEKVTYTILSGADSVWNTSAGGEVVVRADGDFDKFVSLQVDGKTLDKDDYTAVSGSTIVTLKPAFLKTLPAGEHTITFVYTDGTVSTQFEVKDVAVDGSPATGDAFSIMFMLMLMTMSMLAFVTMKREHIKEK